MKKEVLILFHSFQHRLKIVRVLEDKLSNWRAKGVIISGLIEMESDGLDTYLKIVEKHRKAKVRKAAASVAAYMKYTQVVPRFIDRIFLEKDWSVRYALATSIARLSKEDAVEKLDEKYNAIQKQLTDETKKYYLTVHYAECLGAMGREEAIPILVGMLEQAIEHQRKQTNVLIVQVLYSLGEVGNEEVIDLLVQKRYERAFFAENVKNSAHHAMDKLAKKYGSTSISRYLEKKNDS